MDVPKHKVRILRKTEIPQALALWRQNGFPEDMDSSCLDSWYEIDDQGFWVAVTEEGEIIGLCSAVANTKDLFHVGLYSAKKEYRGHGIGMAVWKACMNHIGDSNAVVYAVLDKLEPYRDRGGFPIVEDRWNSHCYYSDSIHLESLLMDIPNVDIAQIEDETMKLVLEYDFKLTGYEREKLLRLTVKEPNSTSYLAIEDDTCVGYGVYKLTSSGLGIVGPLYADNQDIAEVLLRRMIMTLPQAQRFCMTIVDINSHAKAIIDKLQNEMLMYEMVVLYTKEKVDLDMHKIFGQFNTCFCPF